MLRKASSTGNAPSMVRTPASRSAEVMVKSVLGLRWPHFVQR